MKVCRLCDAEIKSALFENIFNENLDPPIWTIIADLTDLTILQSDPYTKSVCFQCFDQLQKFHIFRKVVLYTDWKTRRYNDNNNNNDNTGRLLENVDNNFNDCPPIETESEDYILKEEIEEHPLKIENQFDQDCYISEDVDDNFQNFDTDGTEMIDKNDVNDKQEFEDNAVVNEDNSDGQRSGSPIDVGSDDYMVLVEEEAIEIVDQINDDDQNDEITNINEELTNYSNTTDDKVNGNHESLDRGASSPHNQVKIIETMQKIENSKSCNNKPHQCDVCKKTFSCKSNLNIHLRIHTGDKPYQCTICNKKFPYTTSLKVHLKSNTVDNQCKVCNKTFSTRCMYRKHLKQHLEPDKTRYQCNICYKTYANLHTLVTHRKIHTGETYYHFNNNYDPRLTQLQNKIGFGFTL